MTARMVVPVQHGMSRLSGMHLRNGFTAFTFAVDVHLLLIGIYCLVVLLEGPAERIISLRKLTPEWVPSPSVPSNPRDLPVVPITPISKLDRGLPVPIPDVQADPAQSIPTQHDLSRTPIDGAIRDNLSGIRGSTGEIDGQGEIPIEIPGDDIDPDPFRPVEKIPVPVQLVNPTYPDLALRMGIEGTVVVSILVDKQGRAKKAKILKSDNEALNDAAIAAALQWVFTPAIMNSGPVAVWAAVPFHFRLNR